MNFLNQSMKRVCAVMCTYGRFDIVKQSLTMFLAQDYPNKQLVIFNTAPTPLEGNDFLRSHPDIKIVNQQHKFNGQPYQSLGDVRNASLEHAEGDIYICWDDDDLFMPWHISQAMAHYNAAPVKAWKPDVSYFSQDGGESYQGLMGNAMEASFVVSMKHIKTHGFSTGRSGAEHVDGGWLDKCEPLVENVSPFESYGYIWGDQRCGHKTSGHINDESNFDNHKTASDDFGSEPLSVLSPHLFDKFFKSSLAVWDNPSAYDGMDVQVTVQSVRELKDLMRSYYLRNTVEVPDFLRDSILAGHSQPVDDSNNPYTREYDQNGPPHGVVESFVVNHSGHRKHGYFVEFGGVDGLSQSNSYRLEHDLDWRGILIEAHPESFSYLQKNRPDVVNVNEVISSEDGREVDWIQFDKFKSGQGNFDHSRIYDESLSCDSPPADSSVTLTKRVSRSLKAILDEQKAPRHIDMLVIDIETSDLLEVVKSIPFDSYTFDYIGIEIPAILLSGEFFDCLIKHGFCLVHYFEHGPDYIFARKEIL